MDCRKNISAACPRAGIDRDDGYRCADTLSNGRSNVNADKHRNTAAHQYTDGDADTHSDADTDSDTATDS